ncbi:hypothetical protein AD998_17200 [bacterium 336/3]|nr:hypothetical protein AD998_17200 [bacterium 336/3]
MNDEKVHSYGQLYKTFGLCFFRKRIIGGAKGFLYPLGLQDWVVQARYLLTQITPKHIRDMFWWKEIFTEEYFIYSIEYPAVWLAGLLQDEYNYTNVVNNIPKQNTNNFFDCVYYATLLLYDKKEVNEIFIDIIEKDKKPSPDGYRSASHLAFAALSMYDEKYQTNFTNKYIEADLKKQRAFILIKGILDMSEILRADIEIKDIKEFQKELHDFLMITTPPEYYYKDLLNYSPIDTITREEALQYTSQEEIFLKCVYPDYYPSYNIIKGKRLFENMVLDFISSNCQKSYAYELMKVALLSDHYSDLLAGIELDFYYQIPIEVVDIVYTRVLEMLPHSISLYQNYAFNLLVRGNNYDEKAKQLYQKAEKIKKNICYKEDNKYRLYYPLKK